MAKIVKPPTFKVTHHGRNIHIVNETATSLKWERWILVLSDVHFDSPACDRDMLKRLLQTAVKRDAMIINNGDWYDLCQGRTDPRQDKSRLRSNLAATAYFDEVIDETATFLCDEIPGAAERFILWGAGNHETSWERHHESCAVTNTVRALKSKCKTQCGVGGYGGWMKVQLEAGGNHLTFTIKYFHGAGGGFGAAKNMFSWVESCDCIICGHDHNTNIIGVQREYLSSQNGAYRVLSRFCSFVRVGTLSKGYEDGAKGYEAQLGSGPKPCRQKWIRLFVDYESIKATTTGRNRMRPRMNWEVLDAQ